MISLSSSAAQRALQLALLTLAVAAAAYSRMTLGPLQEAMRGELGISDNQMALLQGPALAWPLVLAAVPIGLLIDRRSRVRFIQVCAVIDVVGTALLALAENFPLLLGLRCFVAIAVCATNPAVLSLLGDLFPPEQRGRATMVIATGGYAGTAAAFAFGGALIVSMSWEQVVLATALPLAAIACALLVLREPVRTAVVRGNQSIRQAIVEAWAYRRAIAPTLTGIVLVEIGINAALSWAAPALSRAHSLAADRVGFIVATAVLVSGVVGPMSGGMLADLCQRSGGSERSLRALGAVSFLGAFAALFPVLPNETWAASLLVVFLTAISAIIVMSTTLFTVVIPNEIRGLCITVMIGTTVIFGLALAPLCVSALSTLSGGDAQLGSALAVVGVVSCVGAGVVFGLASRAPGAQPAAL